MKLRYNLFGLAVAAAALAPVGLVAGDGEFSAKVGIVRPLGDMLTGYSQTGLIGSTGPTTGYARIPVMATKATGFGFEVGYDWTPDKDNGMGWGLQAGFHKADGNTNVSYGADVKTGVVGADLIYQVLNTPLTVRTGPMLSSWDVTQKKPATGQTGALGETTWKLGWRLGAEYRIAKDWTASLIYGQSSWKTGINPSYLLLQAGYKFNF
jgi:long-subunit fatty acid transport protein